MEQPVAQRSGLPLWLFLLGSLGAVVGFAWSEHDYLAAITVGIMAFCGFWGYQLGAMRQFGAIGALVGAYKLAPLAAPCIAAPLRGTVTNSVLLTHVLSLGIASLTIALSVMFLAKSFSRRWSENDEGFQSGNQLLGFGMGAAQGVLLTLMVLSGAVTLNPIAAERLQQPASSGQEVFARAVAQQVVDVSELAEHSTLSQLIKRYNPFEKVPKLKRIQRRVNALQDPQIFAKISQHPAVVKLQNKPSVRAAMDSLANDPQLREIAMSGKPVSGQTALGLLDNPAVAKLLTQPELLQDIAEALAEFDQEDLDLLSASAPPAPAGN